LEIDEIAEEECALCKVPQDNAAFARPEISEGACRPLIREKDDDVRQEAIRQIVKTPKEKVTSGDVEIILKAARDIKKQRREERQSEKETKRAELDQILEIDEIAEEECALCKVPKVNGAIARPEISETACRPLISEKDPDIAFGPMQQIVKTAEEKVIDGKKRKISQNRLPWRAVTHPKERRGRTEKHKEMNIKTTNKRTID